MVDNSIWEQGILYIHGTRTAHTTGQPIRKGAVCAIASDGTARVLGDTSVIPAGVALYEVDVTAIDPDWPTNKAVYPEICIVYDGIMKVYSHPSATIIKNGNPVGVYSGSNGLIQPTSTQGAPILGYAIEDIPPGSWGMVLIRPQIL